MKKSILGLLVIFTLNANSQVFNLPISGSDTSSSCFGILYDDGGPSGNYSNNANSYFVIDPPGNQNITISFTSFNLQTSYDYLYVYEGAGITGTLLGSYTGTSIPSNITSTSGALTVRFVSNSSTVNSGFSLSWINTSTSAPTASFLLGSPTTNFNTPVQCFNFSSGAGWYTWDFGDGNTSADINPSHSYLSSGTFTITLVAHNCSGTDTTTKTITVANSPLSTINPDTLFLTAPCGSGAAGSFTISNASSGGQMTYSMNLVQSSTNIAFEEKFESSSNQFTNQNTSQFTTQQLTGSAPEGSSYLKLTGGGGSYNGLLATFTPTSPEEISFHIRSDYYGSYNSYVSIGPSGTNNAANDLFFSYIRYNQLRFYYHNGFGTTTYSKIISQNTWYHIELKNIDYLAKTYDIYVNGVVEIAGAGFPNQSLTNVAEINIWHSSYGEASLDHFKLSDQSIINNIVYTPTSGNINSGVTRTFNVIANASTIPAGSYLMFFEISSNDTILDGYQYPFVLTVSGSGFFNTDPYGCIDFDSLLTGVSKMDSLQFWNTGCDTLEFTSITSTDPAFSVVNSAPIKLAPNDSTYLNINFTPSSIKQYEDSLILTGSDTTVYICVKGRGLGAPTISLDSSLISMNLLGCNDTIDTTLIIRNIGLGNLTATITGNSLVQTGTISILAITDGVDLSREYPNTVAALGREMTMPYTITTFSGGSTSALTSALSGIDVVLIPEIENSSTGIANYYLAYSTILQNFVSQGGGLIMCMGYGGTLSNLGFFNPFTSSTSSNTLTVNTPTHPILDGITSMSGSNATSSWTFSNPGMTTHVSSGSYSNVASLPYGQGTAVYMGIDWYTAYTDHDELLANAVEWLYQNSPGALPAWLQVDPDTLQVGINDSVVVNLSFISTGLAAGTYKDTISINSNDPLNEQIFIPIEFIVTGTAEIVTPTACVAFDSTLKFSSLTDSVWLYSVGCDSLHVTSSMSSTGDFTINPGTFSLAVSDSIKVEVVFTPSASGLITDTIMIIGNDTGYICVSGMGLEPPQAIIDTALFSAAAYSCNDTIVKTIDLHNTGLGNLNFNIVGGNGNTGTIEILAITDGADLSREYPNTINALSTHLTSPYNLSTYNGGSASGLAAALAGKHVILIPEIENSSYASYYLTYQSVIQNFVSNGGGLVMCAGNVSAMSNVNVFTGFTPSSSNYTLANNTPSHPIMNGVTSVNGSSATYSTTFTNSNLTTHVSNGSYSNVASMPYGAGNAVYVGIDFYTSGTSHDLILANAVEYVFSNGGELPSWLKINPDSGNVATSDSTTLTFKFISTGLTNGVYADTVLIHTNDPLNNPIKIPVEFTVNGQAEADILPLCVAFDSTMIGQPLTDSVWVYSVGCDSLHVTGYTNPSGAFSISPSTFNLTQGDSLQVQVTFNPNAIQLFNDTIFLTGNDSSAFICVTGEGLGVPILNYNPTSFNLTLNKCNGKYTDTLEVWNSGLGSMSWEAYSSIYTLDSLTTVYVGTGASTSTIFNGLPTVADTMILTIVLHGDFDSGSEYASLNINGTNLGIIPDNNTLQRDTITFIYTGTQLANWISGGQLTINLQNSPQVHIFTGNGNSHTVIVELKSNTPWLDLLGTTSGYMPPSGTQTIPVEFDPTNLPVGSYTSSITIVSNDTNGTISVPVTMTVVDEPEIAIADSCLDFGNVQATYAKDSIPIYNKGCQNLIISGYSFSNTEFSTTQGSDSILPGDSMYLVVDYNPVTAGIITGSVTVNNNDTNLVICLKANTTLAPQANYSYNVLDNCNGQVQFMDNSTGNATSWKWEFGDGKSSTLQNPIHVFEKPGTYLVKLVSTNSIGSDSTTISVNMNGILYVAFNMPDTAIISTIVNFTSTSQFPTNESWDFGDGGVGSGSATSHIYLSTGIRTVKLTVSNAVCQKTTSKKIVIIDVTSVGENGDLEEIRVYPNPTSHFIHIDGILNAKVQKVEVLDRAGRLVYSSNIKNDNDILKIECSRWAKGQYFVVVRSTPETKVVKVIVE